MRELVSGSQKAATVQLQEEIGREGRDKLLLNSEFRAEISTADALAMKANLRVPWNKLRLMRKYVHHVCIMYLHVYSQHGLTFVHVLQMAEGTRGYSTK